MKIEVRQYDPAWARQFAAVATTLADALTGVPIVGIEHVGSTSVPGLAAKPILDIDVIVAAGNVDAASDALTGIGYRPLGEHGIPDRFAFEAPDHLPRQNLYVVVDGSLALRNHLAVRDVLRSNTELRERYGQLKLALANRSYASVDGYVADKTDLIEQILVEGGLSAEDLAAIRELNASSSETS